MLLDELTEAVAQRLEQPAPAVERTWLTVREAAEYLRVSRSQMYKLVRLGEIPSYQPTRDGKLLLKREELDGWITNRRRST